jgi:hypothetical protein
VKWLILIVVLILAAPTIANRLQALDPEKRDAQAAPAPQRRRGFVYRAVRRFGPRPVLLAFILIVVVLAVAVYLLIGKL